MKKSKIISTKGLTKNLINKYSIINGAKCLSSRWITKLFSIYIS